MYQNLSYEISCQQHSKSPIFDPRYFVEMMRHFWLIFTQCVRCSVFLVFIWYVGQWLGLQKRWWSTSWRCQRQWSIRGIENVHCRIAYLTRLHKKCNSTRSIITPYCKSLTSLQRASASSLAHFLAYLMLRRLQHHHYDAILSRGPI